ncbi:MAG: SDR family oxidoreductase [Actinomycetota bacterium]|nr:SDR family oxidoreductase [Actinomycetota bacterium]
MGLLDGKVAIVTGAGRGIGRGEALLLAREGARVVVNDVGASVTGQGHDASPAELVVKQIEESGGEAIVNDADVSDFEATKAMVDLAIERFGRLDIVVNNAGILRDRMLVNMTPEEWDAVMSVHLRGTFNTTRHAVAHWRELSKAGEPVAGRVINTSSPSGLYGNVGQSNYGAAKAGIAAFTVIVAQEVGRYGVTVNAVSPSARTRMTEQAFGTIAEPESGFDTFAPENIAPIVCYLASDDAAGITGQVFGVQGGSIALLQGWTPSGVIDKSERWEPAELMDAIEQIVPGKKIQPDPMAARLAAGQQPLISGSKN